jgi:diguanylate cyclase (GGDEF)-like protein
MGTPFASRDANMPLWVGRIHPIDRPGFERQLDSVLRGWKSRFDFHHRVAQEFGGYRTIEGSATAMAGPDGNVAQVLGIARDTTRQRLVERRFLMEAYHDPLTGLPNRVYFDALVEQSLQRRSSHDEGQPAVMIIELDQFNRIADGMGHAGSNDVLRAVADRLRVTVRPGDTLARLNSHEFGLLLEATTGRDEIEAAARAIQSAFERAFHLELGHVHVSVCIGFSVASECPTSAETLVENAVRAAHHAKASGATALVAYQPVIQQDQREAIQQEAQLRLALEREEFSLRFQPIVHLSTGRLAGFEALLRWNRGFNGEWTPSRFIPLAEKIGLIIPLGRWVLTQAARQISTWHARDSRHRHLSMNINLSTRQLADPELLRHLESLRDEAQLPSHALRLEITESVMMDDANLALAVFQKLKEIGVGIHVDDFGTGYSSLSSLPQFPIDTLKIDQSFVARMLENPRCEQVVWTILDLAKALDLEVTAEGIESRAQWEKLRELGCQHGQGYYFSPPLDVAGVEQLLDADRSWA